MSVPKLIKRVRLLDVDCTQAEFAERLGVAKNTVSTWEQGHIPDSWVVVGRVLSQASPELRQALIEELATRPRE